MALTFFMYLFLQPCSTQVQQVSCLTFKSLAVWLECALQWFDVACTAVPSLKNFYIVGREDKKLAWVKRDHEICVSRAVCVSWQPWQNLFLISPAFISSHCGILSVPHTGHPLFHTIFVIFWLFLLICCGSVYFLNSCQCRSSVPFESS